MTFLQQLVPWLMTTKARIHRDQSKGEIKQATQKAKTQLRIAIQKDIVMNLVRTLKPTPTDQAK